jgi:hypothetical protein
LYASTNTTARLSLSLMVKAIDNVFKIDIKKQYLNTIKTTMTLRATND